MSNIYKGPAIFCQVIAIKNCFYQLEQIGIYDENTLQPYGKKLKQLESLLTEDEQNCALPPPILELIRYNYSACSKFWFKYIIIVLIFFCIIVERIYGKLSSSIRDMSPTL